MTFYNMMSPESVIINHIIKIGTKMRYLIECDGIVYGPFRTNREAAEWALDNCAATWHLRTLHIVPPKNGDED